MAPAWGAANAPAGKYDPATKSYNFIVNYEHYNILGCDHRRWRPG